MKFLGLIEQDLDVVTKEYVDNKTKNLAENTHTHSEYASKTELVKKSDVEHNHDGKYAQENHTHINLENIGLLKNIENGSFVKIWVGDEAKFKMQNPNSNDTIIFITE